MTYSKSSFPTRMIRAVGVVLLLLAGACATHRVDLGPDLTGAGGDVAALVAVADELWAARDDQASVQAALDAYLAAYAADPKNLYVATMATRAAYFLADAYITGVEAQSAAYSAAISFGDKALGINPGFAAAIEDGRPVSVAVEGLTTRAEAEALYWRSSALGKWASSQGFGTVVKYKNEIVNSMTKVTELAPDLYYHGPDRYWGAYYARAPAFAGGDMAASKDHFEASIAGSPDFLATYVLYAQYWAVKSQDRAKFSALLNKVLSTDPGVIPEVRAEQVQEQRKAEKLLAQIDDFFAD